MNIDTCVTNTFYLCCVLL